jgi:hypothetical protein
LQFGLPSLGLTLSSPITITIPVTGVADGVTLDVYSKTPGGSWTSLTTCVVGAVTTGKCTFTTTHLSDFSTGKKCSSVSNGTVGSYPTCTLTCDSGYTKSGNTCVANSSGGGGGSTVTPACTSVVYGAFTNVCFGGYQYRNIDSRVPSNCALTAAQQSAARRACESTAVSIEIPGNSTGLISGASNSASFVALEKSLVKKINKALTGRLSGRILLQVEDQGQAWYVNPVNGAKYFLGTPSDAYAVMRKLALGVSNKTFATFKNGKAPAKLAGRILLKVEDKGMAYYVNPIDLKMYYLGRPADAFSVMRKLGLGINNTNLRQIKVDEAK